MDPLLPPPPPKKKSHDRPPSECKAGSALVLYIKITVFEYISHRSIATIEKPKVTCDDNSTMTQLCDHVRLLGIRVGGVEGRVSAALGGTSGGVGTQRGRWFQRGVRACLLRAGKKKAEGMVAFYLKSIVGGLVFSNLYNLDWSNHALFWKIYSCKIIFCKKI